MNYCPYCAGQISEDATKCPHCKKQLDFELLGKLYMSGKKSGINKKISRRLWLKEHSHIFIPIITLIVGFVVGGILTYGYGQQSFAAERSDYKNKIASLQTTIANKDSAVSNSTEKFQEQLAAKDEIIGILSEQKQILSRIINFTRRFSTNSTITPNSVEESNYFKRNVSYLIRQFENQQENLQATGYTSDEAYNLMTVPQFLSD